MRYRPGDVPALARTPIGRRELRNSAFYQAWPLLRGVATAHRRTLGRRTRVVAVVGSLGKTTTTRTTRAALTGNPAAEANENHLSFVADALLRARGGYAVVEIGIERLGDMARYARMVRPDVVVVTSVASEHGRTFGTLERTRDEKAAMVRALPSSGVAILNGDDPNVRWMAGETAARVVTFGFSPDVDVRATEVDLDWPHGTRLVVHADGRTLPVRTRLLGADLTRAVLAAIAVVLAEGRELEPALAVLEQVPPTPLRLQPAELPGGAYLLRDEFKSALETVHTALDVLAEIPAGRRIAVLGEISEPPGSQGPIYGEVGARLARIADRVVIVGRNVRRYRAGAARAGMPRGAILDARGSALRAIELVREDLRPGDVVLVKGRDTQKLERISLGLLGHDVRCGITTCHALTRCDECPMLGRSWDGLSAVI